MFALMLLENALIIHMVGCSGNLGSDYARQASDGNFVGTQTAVH